MLRTICNFRQLIRIMLLLALLIPLTVTLATASRTKNHSGRHKKKPAATAPPVINAVMFWMKDCSHCERVKTKVLPPLYAKYGEQLKIKMIEVETSYDEDALYKIAASHKLEEDETGVPFLMLGQQVFVGDRPIERDLPGLIEKHLASGGLPFPDNPVLKTYLAAPRPAEAPPPKSKAIENESMKAGLVMAAVLAAIMIVALVASSAALIPATSKARTFLQYSPWPDRLIPVLCITGLVVAGYLTKIEYSGNAPFCGTVHGCDKVQSSEYAWIIRDVLPVGLLGLIGYLAMLVSWFWGTYRRGPIASFMTMALFGMTFLGTIYSLYLTWIELFAIKAACIWCMINADLVTLVMLLSLPAAIKIRYESSLRKWS